MPEVFNVGRNPLNSSPNGRCRRWDAEGLRKDIPKRSHQSPWGWISDGPLGAEYLKGMAPKLSLEVVPFCQTQGNSGDLSTTF